MNKNQNVCVLIVRFLKFFYDLFPKIKKLYFYRKICPNVMVLLTNKKKRLQLFNKNAYSL